MMTEAQIKDKIKEIEEAVNNGTASDFVQGVYSAYNWVLDGGLQVKRV